MPDTWIVDLRHFLNRDGSFAPTSGPALRLALHFAEIVREITADMGGETSFPKVRCRRKPKRIRCTGAIQSDLDVANDAIVWECPVCGDNGAISNWEGTLWDFSEVSEWH